MTSAVLFFSVGTIGLSTRSGRSPSTLLSAARHNKRAQQRERGSRWHIDAALSYKNENLVGPDTPEGVAALARTMMEAAGVAKLRRDYTQAIELLFSMPPDTPIDTGVYFRRCVDWAGGKFGAGNILSADIHRDESAPHCHVLVLPLVAGKMCGSALVAKGETAKLRESFGREVAHAFGLKAAGRVDGATRGAAVRAVLDRLNATADPAMKSPLWQTIRRAIELDPMPYADALGVEVATPERKARSFADIMTSKGRATSEDRQRGHSLAPSKAIGFDETGEEKPIGFARQEMSKPISVGFAQITTHSTPAPSAGSAGAVVARSFHAARPSSPRHESAENSEQQHRDGGQAEESARNNRATAQRRPTKASQYLRPDTPETIAASRALARRMGASALELWEDVERETFGEPRASVESKVGDMTRDREDDQWCEVLGEFIQAPIPSREARAAAGSLVAGLLAKHSGRRGYVRQTRDAA